MYGMFVCVYVWYACVRVYDVYTQRCVYGMFVCVSSGVIHISYSTFSYIDDVDV